MWTCHSISFIEAVKMQSASAMLFSLCYGFLIIILTLISFWIYHNCIIFKMLRMDQLVFCVMPMIPAYLLINWRQMNQERDTCSVWSEMFEMFFFISRKIRVILTTLSLFAEFSLRIDDTCTTDCMQQYSFNIILRVTILNFSLSTRQRFYSPLRKNAINFIVAGNSAVRIF